MRRRVFIDLDGVLADFDRHYEAMFGRPPEGVPDEEKWPLVYGVSRFFADMPLCPGAADFWQRVGRRLDMTVLTACTRSRYEQTAIEKREWVRTHLGPYVVVLPVMGGINKRLFMHAPGDILIDDLPRNIDGWNAFGGVGVLHTSFDDTIDQLADLYREDVVNALAAKRRGG